MSFTDEELRAELRAFLADHPPPDLDVVVSDEDADGAKAVCATCVVREACLEFALTNREHDGVWGGATERERRRIVRQRRKSA